MPVQESVHTVRQTASGSFPTRWFPAVVCLSILALTTGVYGQEKDPEGHGDRSGWLSAHLGSMTEEAFEVYEHLFDVVDAVAKPPEWTALGPTGYVSGETTDNSVNRLGRVNVLAFHPTDFNVIYAGTPNSSLWKGRRTGDGVRWTQVVDSAQVRKFPPLLAISGIAIDPAEPERIYVLTGDGIGGNGGLPAVPSFGVMKSEDGGRSWNPTGLLETFHKEGKFPYWSFKLVMDPCDSAALLALTSRGIYRTGDGGESWSLVQEGYFRDLEFQPTPCSSSDGIVYAATLGKIYRSTDRGKSWKRIEVSFPPIVASQAEAENSFIALAVTPAKPSYVYAVVGTGSGGFTGLYRSEDTGKTYSLRSATPNVLGSSLMGDGTGSLAFFGGTLAVSPHDPEDVYLGRMNSWRSGDGGLTWCISSYWQPTSYLSYLHADVHVLELRKASSPKGDVYDLYAATDGGVSMAKNATAIPAEPALCALPWRDVSDGLRITQAYNVCGTPQHPDLVYLGNQDNGTYRLGGPRECHEGRLQTEQTACTVSNSDGGTCLIHPQDSKIVYMTKQSGRILKTTDGGDRVVSVTPPAPSSSLSNQYLTPMAMDPLDPDTVYACYSDLWMTRDGGLIWSNVSQDQLGDAACEGLVVTRSGTDSQGILYVAKNPSGVPPIVYWSSDGGSTWASETLGSTGLRITDIDVSAGDPNRAWITSVPKGAETGLVVFELDVTTGTVRELDHELAAPPPLDTLIDYGRATSIVHVGKTAGQCDRLFLGTQIGVFYGECNETSCRWFPFMSLPLLILDLEAFLEADGRPGRLLAASYGQGAWRLDDPLRHLEEFLPYQIAPPCK